ncbi:MAG TPA: hypothetical protein VGM10_11655 [Actinocrinis sp.]
MITGEAARLGEQAAHDLSRSDRCRIGPGLSKTELSRIEEEYGFEFADDHRAFLAAGLPLNTPIPKEDGVIHTHTLPWPDWRDGDPEELRERLSRPSQGVLFDVEHNRYWHESWGARPDDQAETSTAAERHLQTAPRMIPVFGHRYLPGGRATFGHPVLSMWQTDIICYGNDLVDYIRHEFGGPDADLATPGRPPQVTVPFWRDFV